MTDLAVLEFAVREDLNKRALRRLAVLRPVKIVLTNYPDGKAEELDAVNNPEDPAAGAAGCRSAGRFTLTRTILWRTHRRNISGCVPAGKCGLKYAYIIKCDKVVKDASGSISNCAAPLTWKARPAGRRPGAKSREQSIGSARRTPWMRKSGFTTACSPWPSRMPSGDFKAHLNPKSLEVLTAKCEPSLADAKAELRYQFERLGYFALEYQRGPKARLQPDHHPAGHLGQRKAEGIMFRVITKGKRAKSAWLGLLCLAIVACVSGCENVSYYGQAVFGEVEILGGRKPVSQLLADPRTPSKLKERLRDVNKIRQFAARELKEPIAGAYVSYTELYRSNVAWNVNVAPPLSLDPVTWWYPFVGQASYRGYFHERAARRYASRWERQGSGRLCRWSRGLLDARLVQRSAPEHVHLRTGAGPG